MTPMKVSSDAVQPYINRSTVNLASNPNHPICREYGFSLVYRHAANPL